MQVAPAEKIVLVRHTLETIQNGSTPGAAGLLKPLDPAELLKLVEHHAAE